jgi:prepilin signal peptidase PulO-like enzyme (type II secretory pathway)
MTWFFVFGLIVGSFLNVVIYRYNTGQGIGGRSRCFSCGRGLRWFELIPVVSLLLQRGRCRHCGSKISIQYLLVELLTGILFLAAYLKVGLLWPDISLLLLIFSALVVIAVYDLRHKIIPDGVVYTFSFLAILLTRFQTLYLIAGVGLFLFFASLWLVSGGRWMGFGDAKLALGIGFMLGPILGVSAVIVAFWSGALWGLGLMLLSHTGRLLRGGKSFTMKSELPFAPFLILGLLWTYFTGFNVIFF